MLVRPAISRHRCSSQARARGCLAGSLASCAYSRTLVSTKTRAFIQFLPLWVVLALALELPGLAREEASQRLVVLARFAHVLLQELADEAGQAYVALRGMHARPCGGDFIERNGDVLHRPGFCSGR